MHHLSQIENYEQDQLRLSYASQFEIPPDMSKDARQMESSKKSSRKLSADFGSGRNSNN